MDKSCNFVRAHFKIYGKKKICHNHGCRKRYKDGSREA